MRCVFDYIYVMIYVYINIYRERGILVMGHVLMQMMIGGWVWSAPSPQGGGGNSVAALTSPWHASHYCPPFDKVKEGCGGGGWVGEWMGVVWWWLLGLSDKWLQNIEETLLMVMRWWPNTHIHLVCVLCVLARGNLF